MPELNYITQLNRFEESCATLSPRSQLIYYKLFKLSNRFGLGASFYATNSTLMLETGIMNKETFIRNRNALQQLGFIKFRPGKKGKASEYQLVDLTRYGYNMKPYTVPYNEPIIEPKTVPINEPITEPKTVPQYKVNKTKTKNNNSDSVKINSDNLELLRSLNDFFDMRKAIKKPMTERAKELLIGKLDNLAASDEDKIAILNQSIENSWQGVFPLKQMRPWKGDANGKTARHNIKSAAEEAAENKWAGETSGWK